MITVIHTDYRGDNTPDRANKASIEVKYFVDVASRHTCPHPLWPDDPYVGNDARWHQISSDIDQWPLLDNHWYKVKVVFNSDITEGDGAPVDIFLDDQGEDPYSPANELLTELWTGYVNASKSIQDSSSCKWGAVTGDYIATENQPAYIGTPRPPSSGVHAASHIFDGAIDWITWKPIADYSDVIFNGSSVQAGQSQFGSTVVNEPYDYWEDLGMYVSSANHSRTFNDSVNQQDYSVDNLDVMNSVTDEGFKAASDSEISIRICEGCHGFESLHNIQKDSDGNDIIDPGSELPYFGHIGHNDDCWGCHGFDQSSASAPGTGPVVPYITSSDTSVVTAGTDRVVILSGNSFINFISTFELTSNVMLTASDGISIELVPDSISENTLTVTIPGTLAPDNYHVRAVKGPSESNPIVISIKPAVVLTDANCNRKKGVLTINGSGFGGKPEGTDDYINVEVDAQIVDIISWSDTQIKASVSNCSKRSTVTVNALYGSASSADNGGGGKPDKPCKGKRC